MKYIAYLLFGVAVFAVLNLFYHHTYVPKHYTVDYQIGVYHDTVMVFDNDRVVVKCRRDSMWYYLDKDNE